MAPIGSSRNERNTTIFSPVSVPYGASTVIGATCALIGKSTALRSWIRSIAARCCGLTRRIFRLLAMSCPLVFESPVYLGPHCHGLLIGHQPTTGIPHPRLEQLVLIGLLCLPARPLIPIRRIPHRPIQFLTGRNDFRN